MQKILLLIPLIAACNSPHKKEVVNQKTDTIIKDSATTSPLVEIEEDSINWFADYYLVIADKSSNYNDLHKKMFALHNDYQLEIDTLGRYYNSKRNEIIVPEDDEDEIYQGQYYPRRYESESVSIEYEYIYLNDQLEPKKYPTTMLLVAGMYADKEKADRLQNILQKNFPETFVLKSKVYQGCMH